MLTVTETTIGRNIVERKYEIFNVLADNPEPPNLYQWKFSREYPDFPPENNIEEWDVEKLRRCQTALQKGHLTVSVIKIRSRARKSIVDAGQLAHEAEEEVSDGGFNNRGGNTGSSSKESEDQPSLSEGNSRSQITARRRELVQKAEEVFTKHIRKFRTQGFSRHSML